MTTPSPAHIYPPIEEHCNLYQTEWYNASQPCGVLGLYNGVAFTAYTVTLMGVTHGNPHCQGVTRCIATNIPFAQVHNMMQKNVIG